MKRLLFLLTAVLLSGTAVRAQDACHITITGSFDSECIYDFKDLYRLEYPDVMVACRNSTVTYTAFVDPAVTAVGYSWEVTGDVSHTASGNQATVSWGNGGWGLLTVTVTAADGTVCTSSAYVKLIASPTAASSTVPAYTVDNQGNRVIRVCRHSRVEFIDQSDGEGSDIAGHLWECYYAQPSSTPHYVIDDVVDDDRVVHRVYNNCGCYDEEVYYIEVLEGDGAPLELECYGTACEGSVATYTATSPTCQSYRWHVEGGTLVGGQYTASPTVQWDRPQGGYGVLSLDGVACSQTACPALLSARVPVIQDSLAVEGPRKVCLGESAVYRLPLFGSTRYEWSVTPTLTGESAMADGNEMRYTFTSAGVYRIKASYVCDFLGCGPRWSEELEVTVLPTLAIEGAGVICCANPCSLYTDPPVAATWQAYDLGNGNQPVGTAATGPAFSQTFPTGRYLVTAAYPDYCGPATFVLVVKDPPPAPTVDDLSPDNRHAACPNGGICLTGTPSEAGYSLVWAPACSTATPQVYTGDSANISYQNDVCDVYVYNYDRVLQCQSSAYYVHTVSALTPQATTLPAAITVCPNSIVSFNGEVPDQSGDGMLYEWKIDPLQQHCATVQGSHQQSNVVLLINDLHATSPYSFYVELTRTCCNNQSATSRVNITVRDDLSPAVSVTGPTTVCVGSQATYTLTGCPANCTPVTYTFPQEGLKTVNLYCNPYDYCNNKDLYIPASVTVSVIPAPEATVSYSQGTNTLTVNATGGGPFTYAWYYRSGEEGFTPVYLGNSATVQPTDCGYYECEVTDQTTLCSTEVSYEHCQIVPPPCNPMTLGHGTYDYCNHSLRVTSPYSTSPVAWTVTGGDCEIQKSGTNNHIADIVVSDIGTYTVCAKTLGPELIETCYEGCYTFTADFVPDFEFIPKCDRIVIRNNSGYLSGINTVYMSVRDNSNNSIEYVTFPVSLGSYTYIPTPSPMGVCTYTFSLTGYGTDGNVTQPCDLGSVTIGGTLGAGDPVSISTNNPYDTPSAHNTCDNTPIRLDATLNYPGAFIVSSSWNFGDGSYYTTDENSVYHTFSQGFHGVSVTITDSRGCERTNTSPLNITSHNDALSGGNLSPLLNPVCPHLDPPIQEVRFSPNNVSSNHYTWNPPLTGTDYNHLVSEPGVYSVSVVDNNFCQKKGSTPVAFKPCPTARIHAESFSCCPGEPLKLYGSMAPATGMAYLWNITATGYSETFNTGDIVFTPPAAGAYAVELTVTDNSSNSGCTSTAHATVTANAQPPAPQLYFPGDSCISGAPVAVSATAASYSGQLHWSNGTTGGTADYFTPGLATAYYFDPAIGCPSLTGSIRIHHQPDFDALLTGCYEKCAGSLYGYRLPVYCLTPDSIDWQWYLGGGVTAWDIHKKMPLWLPLDRPGTYRLEVDYQNGGCHAVSPNLTITEKQVCDCDSIRVTVSSITSEVVDCRVLYIVKLEVCNDNADPACFNTARVISDNANVQITDVTFPVSIAANDCEAVYVKLAATGLIPTSVLLQLEDNSCLRCTKEVSVDLMPAVDCHREITDAYVWQEETLTDDAAVYCTFKTGLPHGCRLLAIWSEPAMVLDYQVDAGTDVLDALLMFDRAKLVQIAGADSTVCVHIVLCCGDELCIHSYCVGARNLLSPRERETDSPDEGAEMFSTRPVHPNREGVALAGNPTTGQVSIVGATGTVVEVLVLDMHGRRVALHEGVSSFDAASLPAGTYIVRVSTQADADTPVERHYLKLVKK